MIEASAVDTPTKRNRAGDQMTQRPGNIVANAHRPKSFADNLNYRQKSGTQMTKPKRDTWSDWFDDADQVEQVTLEELIEVMAPHLQGADQVVTGDTVRYWQRVGVLPQPVKRWHEGATRAMYPKAYTSMAIFTILHRQSQGYTLAQIADYLPRRLKAQYLDYEVVHGWNAQAQSMATEFTEKTGLKAQRVEIVIVDKDDVEHPYWFVTEGEESGL